MAQKLDLKRMLREIEQDERTAAKQHEQLSQSEIRRLFAARRKDRRPAP